MARAHKATAIAVTPRDICAAAVKQWGIALQGLQVRTIVRTTDRVPRLQGEPAEGNRSHVYTAQEATMVVDGLTARSSMAHLDADRLLTALGVPVTARQEARRDYIRRRGGQASPKARVTAKAPSKAATARKAPGTPNRALGERAVRVKAPSAPEAPSA